MGELSPPPEDLTLSDEPVWIWLCRRSIILQSGCVTSLILSSRIHQGEHETGLQRKRAARHSERNLDRAWLEDVDMTSNHPVISALYEMRYNLQNERKIVERELTEVQEGINECYRLLGKVEYRQYIAEAAGLNLKTWMRCR